jgi:hypothetical protein
LSRDLDLGIQSTVMRAAILGADLRHIDAPYYTTNFHLVVNPEKVRTPTDLVGQAIGVGSRGGTCGVHKSELRSGGIKRRAARTRG